MEMRLPFQSYLAVSEALDELQVHSQEWSVRIGKVPSAVGGPAKSNCCCPSIVDGRLSMQIYPADANKAIVHGWRAWNGGN